MDNLKLGYGGTKTEMQRLLADAQKLTGVEYNIDNLGDVYEAIHVIQGDLGLTGVAAAEASETFSGSFEAMKASASNLLGAIALGENVSPMMMKFVKSVNTFVVGNLLPMLGTVAKSIPQVISAGIIAGRSFLVREGPTMINKLVSAIQTAIPKLITLGLKLLTSIQTGIVNNLPALMNTANSIITNIGTWITENLPIMIDTGKHLLAKLIDGIVSVIPTLATAASNIITNIANFLAANLPTIGEKGGQLLQVLATKIISAIPQVIAAAAKIAVAIGKALVKLAPIALKAAVSLIKGLVSGIKAGGAVCKVAAKQLIDTKIMPHIKAMKEKVKGVLDKVKSTMATTWENIKSTATSVWNTIKSAITKPIEEAKTNVSNAISTIKNFFPISAGKIFTGLKLPHFTVTGGKAPWGIGGMGEKPTFKVDWYKKAMGTPYIFDKPTLFGAGEAGDEIMYGRANLMQDIKNAVGGGRPIEINITNYIDGAEAPEEYASRLARQLQRELRMV